MPQMYPRDRFTETDAETEITRISEGWWTRSTIYGRGDKLLNIRTLYKNVQDNSGRRFCINNCVSSSWPHEGLLSSTHEPNVKADTGRAYEDSPKDRCR